MKRHWLIWSVIKKKKRFRANQTDLTSSKVNSVSQAAILSGIGELQLPWSQKNIQSWGARQHPLSCSCWAAPKQHFQCTAKIPVPLQGLAWWFLSFQSPFFLFLFLIFRLLSNKLLTFWRLLLKQEAWGESWRLQSGYTLGKSHSGSGICVSSAAELLKRSWHQRQNHCLVLLFFSLPFKSLATTAVSHLFQLTSLSP